ncbi:MAG: hypothetical protein QW503_03330 [Sulfolobales archaeon]
MTRGRINVEVYVLVSKPIIAIPRTMGKWYDMVRGFKDLYLMVQGGVITRCLTGSSTTLCLPDVPAVVYGSSALESHWRLVSQDSSRSYRSRKHENRSMKTAQTRKHTVHIVIAGETSVPRNK